MINAATVTPTRLLATAILAIAAMLPRPALTAAPIDAAVLDALKTSPDGRTTVLIKLSEQADLSAAAAIEDWDARGWAVYNALHGTAQRTQAPLLASLRRAQASGAATRVKSFWIVNLVSVQADRATINDLAARPEVGTILPALKLEPPTMVAEPPSAAPTAIEWGISKIRAPEVWSTYGTDGGGIVVANVDTGVQYSHPALVNQYRGNLGGGLFDHNYNWYDPTGASAAPSDNNGHGTHTMGTEVGSDGATNQIGVAPGARWIAAFGCCPDNQSLLDAQQFMLAPTDLAGDNPDPSRRPQVLNQSWGGPGGSEIFEGVITALRASGIFPSFSAGNNGSSAANGCGRLGSPGDNPSAFNVGSTDISDNISSSSSRGPNPFTGRIGPEVSAPGVSVRSSVPSNTYAVFSGTSMASPHVAGAVALLLAVEPKLTGQIAQIEELLRKTAVARTSSQTCGGVAGSEVPNNVFGWGRIDVKAAADMVFQAGYLQGTVTVAGAPTAGVTVSFARLGKTLTTLTDASGNYRVVAGAGSYAMGASFQGQTVNAAAVAVAQNATTQQDFAIAPITHFTVTGTITTLGTGTPVPAMLVISDHESLGPVWADAGGNYSIDIPSGGASVRVIHPGFDTLTVNASVGGVSNLQLTPRQNYTCLDDTQIGGPSYAWIDASAGTAFPLDDDASSTAINLPGTFTYFGTDYTTVRINSNGFLYFGTTSYTTAHMFLPFEGQPNNDLMALGEDLNPALGSQGTIYALTVGSKLVVQYQQVEHWASGLPETFEIILDTASDDILYQYETLSWPDFTTVGVENADGSAGQLYSYRNSADLVSGRAVRFSPASATAVNWGCDHAYTVTVADDSDPVALGETIRYAIHWNVIGFGGAPHAQLTASIPAGTSFVDAAGGIVPSGGVLTWPLGDQRPKSQGNLWFRVTADSIGNPSTSVTISDGAGESRSATEKTSVLAAAEILFQNGFE
jgi:subtilisin family serine protease